MPNGRTDNGAGGVISGYGSARTRFEWPAVITVFGDAGLFEEAWIDLDPITKEDCGSESINDRRLQSWVTWCNEANGRLPHVER
jgi:hypothetical protein